MLNRLRKAFSAALAAYHGDVPDRKRSLIYAPLRSAKFDICASSRRQLQEKSREFERKTAIVNRMADLWETYTVGCGIPVYPMSSLEAFNKAASAEWAIWSRYPDLISKQPFGTLCSLVSRAWFVDGEVFVVRAAGESGRMRLQLIEADRVETPPDLAANEGTSIIDGVEVNRLMRPTGYWIRTSDDIARVKHRRVSADDVIHVFEPSRAGQYRGIPWVHPVVNDIIDLEDLQELEMLACKDAAELSNILKTETGEVSSSGLYKNRFQITDTNSGNATTTETRAEYIQKALGGRTAVLRVNEQLEQHRSERPGPAVMAFWKSLEEKICAGVGIPRILVYPESMQGTVYRGALDAADAFFRARSSVMQSFVQQVYEWVIGAANVSRRLGEVPPDWYNVTTYPPKSVVVDIGYSSDAAVKEIAAGLGGFASWYGQRSKDWRQGLREKAEQAKYVLQLAEELQVDPSMISDITVERPGRTSAEPSGQNQEEDTEDDGSVPVRRENEPMKEES